MQLLATEQPLVANNNNRLSIINKYINKLISQTKDIAKVSTDWTIRTIWWGLRTGSQNRNWTLVQHFWRGSELALEAILNDLQWKALAAIAYLRTEETQLRCMCLGTLPRSAAKQARIPQGPAQAGKWTCPKQDCSMFHTISAWKKRFGWSTLKSLGLGDLSVHSQPWHRALLSP